MEWRWDGMGLGWNRVEIRRDWLEWGGMTVGWAAGCRVQAAGTRLQWVARDGKGFDVGVSDGGGLDGVVGDGVGVSWDGVAMGWEGLRME